MKTPRAADVMDRMLLNLMADSGMRKGEGKELLNYITVSRNEPLTRILLAILRDAMMFRDMTYTYLMDSQRTIRELRARIEQLERRIDAIPESEEDD